VLFGMVLTSVAPKTDDLMPWLPLLAVLAVVSVVIPRTVERPLNCSTPTALAFGYRTRFFLRMAFAQSVALFGFVFAFTAAPSWIYYVGAAFALYRIWVTAAPTRAALARDQQRLSESGCRLSLVRALRTGEG